MAVLRIIYQKTDIARFISANYIGKVFERLLRRLELDIEFTEGFNRRIKMSFGPPLAVGISGRNEIVDVRLKNKNFPCDVIKERLNSFAPCGIKIMECRYLLDSEKSPPEIELARYIVRFAFEQMHDIPEKWKIISKKDGFLELEIPLKKLKHRELFLIFGQSVVIERFLIF